MVYISIAAVTVAGGFALTATHFFYQRLKKVSKKTLAPNVRPLAKARGSFAPAFIRGHCPPVGFARPTCNEFDCVERRCAPIPG